MILTQDEMERVRQTIEEQAYLDDELARRCRPLLRMGAFDEAVRAAFVLLEERLRAAVGEEGLTGTVLAHKAFHQSEGPLAKLLGGTLSEREGLRELFCGAFKLFRNPSAHGAVGYDAADGKAIIGLVNLMLRMVKRASELPPRDLIPENVETILKETEATVGPGAGSRLRVFVGKCLKVGLKPSAAPKMWVPFKRYARVKLAGWHEAKPYPVALFYLTGQGVAIGIRFPTFSYYARIAGFDLDWLTGQLAELGFVPEGKHRELCADLRAKNDQAFFDKLYDLITSVAEELDRTLGE